MTIKHSLRPIKDTLWLWFSWEHSRLRSSRWRSTKKCWPHRCMVHGRGANYGSSRKPTVSWKPEAKIRQRRGASAQHDHADHYGWKSMKSDSSQEQRESGKPDAVLSSKSNEPGDQLKSSIFKHSASQIWEDLFLKATEHLLSQARSELMKQEHQVGSLNNCISELQRQANDQGLELQNAHHGYFESQREQARLQEELSMKENFSEILKYKNSCIGWNEESSRTSVQKLR